jgi:hypothetical protein
MTPHGEPRISLIESSLGGQNEVPLPHLRSPIQGAQGQRIGFKSETEHHPDRTRRG